MNLIFFLLVPTTPQGLSVPQENVLPVFGWRDWMSGGNRAVVASRTDV